MTAAPVDLRDPRLILVADGFTRAERRDAILQAARAGKLWIHLRDHEASAAAFFHHAESLLRALQSLRVKRISINSHLEVARELELDFHTGRHGPSVEKARAVLGEKALIGYSVHDKVEAKGALQAGADYALVSPVFPTSSKPGQPGLREDGFEELVRQLRPLPVYALGGVTPERARACLVAGARGVAVLSGILEAQDPAEAVRTYLVALENEPA